MNLTSINMSFTGKELTKYYGHERTSTSHLILQNESTDRNWIGLQSDWNGNKLKKGAQAYFCVDEVSNCQEFKPTPVFSHRRTWRSQPIQIRPDFDSKRLSIYISPNYRREPLNLPVPKIFESWWDQGKWTGQIFMKQWNFSVQLSGIRCLGFEFYSLMYPTMISVAIMKQESSDSSVRVYGSQLKWR